MEANNCLTAPKQGEVILAHDVVRAVAENLCDDVGGLENFSARGREFAPFST